jgi:hypothetical protein
LGETFILEKGRPRTVFGTVPTDVGTVVKHVKKWEEAAEGRMAVKNKAAGFAGDGIEHVDNVKEEEGVGGGLIGGLEGGNMGFNGGTGEMNDGINTTRDTNTELALGQEVGGKVGRSMF